MCDTIESKSRYTDKYFVSILLYSIFLGIFAVDRCCLGHTGIGIGKLITLGGVGIWYLIDIILLVLGVIKPNDNSNWIPYY
jgi:TM2 domain-containing membrane protein YozV